MIVANFADNEASSARIALVLLSGAIPRSMDSHELFEPSVQMSSLVCSTQLDPFSSRLSAFVPFYAIDSAKSRASLRPGPLFTYLHAAILSHRTIRMPNELCRRRPSQCDLAIA